MSVGFARQAESVPFRSEGGFKTVISPASLLARPDIIPSGFPDAGPPTPIPPEEQRPNYREWAEELRAQLAKATDLNDRYYQRIQALEAREKLTEQFKSERDSLTIDLQEIAMELEKERSRKEFVSHVNRDLEGRGQEVQEQRREIQRLLELGEAYGQRQTRLEQEIEELRLTLSEERRQKTQLQDRLSTVRDEREDRNRVLELQSNLEEQSHRCAQLSKQLREQQDLNQLLTLKLREIDSFKGENSALVQRLSAAQQLLAEVQTKYEKQLAAHYQLQVRLRGTKTQRRPLSCRSSICLQEQRKSEECDLSFEELDRLVATRKAELGLNSKPPKGKSKHWV